MDVADLPTLDAVDSQFPSHPKPVGLPAPISSATRSFWLHSSPGCNVLENEGADAALPDGAVDVVILGSGITGVSTLYHLVQQLKTSGRSVKRIAILEARTFCSGATGRNGGHCTAYNPCNFLALSSTYGVPDTLRHIELERRSVEFVIDLIRENGWEEDVDFVAGGNIHLCSSAEEEEVLRANIDAAREAGVDVKAFQWLSKGECSKLIKSNEHLSGLKIPGTNLYPMKLMTKIYELARAQAAAIGVDVQLFTHTPATAITTSDSRVAPWEVKTPREKITARQVVHATNAYASHLLPALRTGKQRVVPCRGQVIAVRPPPSLGTFWTTGFSYNEGFEYFFQRPSRGADSKRAQIPYVILGGGRSIAPSPYELDVFDDSTLEPHVSDYLHAFLPKHFPSLFPEQAGKVDVDFEWSGIMGFTESRNPYVGPVYGEEGEVKKGQWLSAGYSGHGMSRAPACGEAIARMVVADLEGKPSPHIEWLPEHFLTAGSP